MQERITFYKFRDFGQMFSATFDFLAKEWKLFLGCILRIVGPFIVLAIISFSLSSVYNGGASDDLYISPALEPGALMFTLLGFLMIIISYVMLYACILGYIKCYMESVEGFTVADVWSATKTGFWKVFLASIVKVAILSVGFLLCIIPGIYFMVNLLGLEYAYVVEGKSFGEAFNRSMNTVNRKWWLSFAFLIVLGIIVGVLSNIITLPVFILVGAGEYFSPQSQGAMNLFISLTYGLSMLANLLFLPIQLIGTAFLYFGLVELQEGTGLMNQIDEIGRDDDSKFESY